MDTFGHNIGTMKPHVTHPLGLPRLAALAIIVLLSGCLTIEEHYTFKKDGSGTMEYVMDMSELGGMLEMLANDEEEGGGKSARKGKKEKDGNDKMLSGMEEQAEQLKALPGIKKVKLKLEKDGYLGRISFAFADVGALNGALNVLMPDSANGEQEFFRWEGNTLVRSNNRYASLLGEDVASGDDTTGVAEILRSMKYRMTFDFAEPMGNVELGDGMTREQGKANALDLSTDFAEIMRDPDVLNLRIGLNR